jgi:hypothetical protein
MAGAQTTEQMMKDTHDAVRCLDNIYTRLMSQVDQLKRGGGDLKAIEKLLNQTAPVTEEDRRLTFFIRFMANMKRNDLITFLFSARRSLLLLVDGHAAAMALGIVATHKIWVAEDNNYRIAPVSDVRNLPNDYVDPPRRHNNHQGRHNNHQGRRNYVGHGQPPAAQTPVMNMQDCLQVLAAIDQPAVDADLSCEPPTAAPAAASTPGQLSYRAVLVCGKAPEAVPVVETNGEAAPKEVNAMKECWADMVEEDEQNEAFNAALIAATAASMGARGVTHRTDNGRRPLHRPPVNKK